MVGNFIKRNIAYARNIGLVLTAVFLGCTGVSAQVENSLIAHAVRVLKGIDTDNSKMWAVETLEKAALQDSSSYVMNCLGLAYMAGVGVDADSTKAIEWLEKAGEHGYANAYHNLGTIFKYSRCGVRQDFKRAYNYYSAGADSGSVTCMYDKGFMLYKGLGCGQSYRAAAENFRAAAAFLHAPSLYMLGLCYRNGYGVDADAATAMDYLKHAADLGYRDAMDELERPNAETYLNDRSKYGSDVPRIMPQISPKVNDIALLAGNYSGYLVMYDWSGKNVLGEKPLQMSATMNGAELSGFMIVGNDTVAFSAEITNDSKLLFKQGGLMLNERYTVEGPVKYRMENMLFDVWNDRISGRLNLYSLKLNEPERPMYFELLRDGMCETALDDRYSSVKIAPNPFVSGFKATFELLGDVDAEVRIFNKQGMLVWRHGLGVLNEGKHEIMLSPDINAGTYVINIKAGNQNIHSIITKEK